MNKLVGFTYNDGEEKNYIYRRNIQGDIIGIYDSLGNEVGGYAYDSYGKCYIRYKENSSDKEKAILNINPFRYRGYYYDNETGLYYLNARYYDPEVGRFISPDVLSILDETKGQINGLNLYMYCNDNPIMYVDPSGCLAFFIITAIIGAVIGFGAAVYIDYKDDGQIFNGSVKWYEYLGTTILGGLIGAGLGAFAGMSFAISIPTFGWLNAGGALALGITGTATLTITGAQVLTGIGALTLAGLMMLMSKHRPGMTNRPPFSWITQEEGINAMNMFGGDANKTADYIMNNHFDNWQYGAGSDRNVIKKWLDRVIRKLLGKR